jgi:ferredoxin
MSVKKKGADYGRLLLLPLLTLGMLRQLRLFTPYHWGGIFIDEQSGLRKYMLRRYARIEVRLIALLYWLLHVPVMNNIWVKKLAYHSLAKFMGERMVVGQVTTLDEMLEFIDRLPEDSTIALGPCRCRLATHACDHPLDTDIVILTGAPIWLDLFPTDFHVITREEAREKVKDCYDLALVPMLDRHMYYRGNANYFVICNCCGCTCLPILAYRHYKEVGYHYITSTYRSVIDLDKCTGDGACVEVCAFRERRLAGGKAQVLDCQGCGLCVKFCPSQATRMVERIP